MVAGYPELPLSRRIRVRALAALQRALDQKPARAASMFDSAPAPLQRWAKRIAAPLRIQRPLPARIDPLQAALELEAVAPVERAEPQRASIVIPTRGSGDWLRACLAAVSAYTPPGACELIVVDDGSPDRAAVAAIAARYPHLVLVRRDSDHGFAAAVNAGVKRASSDVLVILNDDALVTPGWLGELLSVLASSSRAALVGPISNDTGDVATVTASYDSLAGMLDHARGCRGEPRVVSKLSLFCAMLRREAFDAAGGLDEGYGSGMFEDDDLCMALRARDLDVVLVPSVFVHHAAGATLRSLDPFEYHALFEVNRARFERRWRAHSSR